MLIQRLVGAAIIAVVVAVPFFVGGLLWMVLIAALAMLAAVELGRMFGQLGYRTVYVASVGLTGVLVLDTFYVVEIGPSLAASGIGLTSLVGPGIVVGVLGPLVWLMFRAEVFERAAIDWAVTVVPPFYLGWTLAHFVLLRLFPGNAGLVWAGAALLGTWAADSGAYFAGRAFGRRKLYPRVSPSKTVEGVIGGALLAMVALGVLFYLAPLVGLVAPPPSPVPLWAHGIVLGLLVAGAAVLGDLSESFLKRATGVKDASQLIPGHGGLLDRLDSLVFCVPVVYYYLVWFAGL